MKEAMESLRVSMEGAEVFPVVDKECRLQDSSRHVSWWGGVEPTLLTALYDDLARLDCFRLG